ncbi:hypothetical protein [Hyphomonas sp.]|uniref:hypothetical protein n=1 Tax=Hyphomonas sp. TaxID=87 RepID=UPI0025C5EA74|nr:hypothetical protein [Hyphomonas sp.]
MRKMSRRSDGAANEGARKQGPTRRLVLGATAAPLFVNLGADQVAHACEAWLADYSERERLIRRWQQLETRLFRLHNWPKLSGEERNQFAEKQEMDNLDQSIDILGDRNRAVLASLPGMFATSSRGICGKLAVALIEVCPDENEEAHLLIASILRDYRALHGS